MEKKYDDAAAVAIDPSRCTQDYITIAGKILPISNSNVRWFLIKFTLFMQMIIYFWHFGVLPQLSIGGATACTTSPYRGQVRDKYCGSKLNVELSATQHAPICGKYFLHLVQNSK